jgi:hypothetical protein
MAPGDRSAASTSVVSAAMPLGPGADDREAQRSALVALVRRLTRDAKS